MINISELRVGNIVLYAQDNDELPVLKIDGDSKTVCLDLLLGLNIELNERDIDPIFLTPEWLAKCGFDYRTDDRVWAIQVGNNSYLEFDDQMLCGVTPETWRDQCPIYIWADVKSIHQLQNLFFALTGEELNIKL